MVNYGSRSKSNFVSLKGLSNKQKSIVRSAGANKLGLVKKFRSQNKRKMNGGKFRNVEVQQFSSGGFRKPSSRFKGGFGSNTYKSTALSAPVSVGYNVENVQRADISLSRTGFIAPVPSSAAFRLATIDIHPMMLPWVKSLSNLYDKYMFTRFSIRYVGQCASDSNGSVYIAYDYDPHHNLATNFWSAQAYDKFTMCPLWGTSSWISVSPKILTDKWYDADTVPSRTPADSWHDRFPGRVVFGNDAGRSLTLAGRIEVSYTIKFSRPTSNNEPPPEISTLYIAPGEVTNITLDNGDDIDSLTDQFEALSAG